MGSVAPLLAVRPLIELQLCEKNERAAHHEMKPMVVDFKVLGVFIPTGQDKTVTSGNKTVTKL